MKKAFEVFQLLFFCTWLTMGILALLGSAEKHWIFEFLLPFVFVLISLVSVIGAAPARLLSFTFGDAQYVQDLPREFEEKIRARFRWEIDELKLEGFEPVFYFAESFPVLRVFLVWPALVFLTMLMHGEKLLLQNGRILFGYPVFSARNKSAYAHPFALGVKFHTGFGDRTVLVSKTFVNDVPKRPGIVYYSRAASICEVWKDHQEQIHKLEQSGKRVVFDDSFPHYYELTKKEG